MLILPFKEQGGEFQKGSTSFISDAAGDEPNLFSDNGLGGDAGRDDVADVDYTV